MARDKGGAARVIIRYGRSRQVGAFFSKKSGKHVWWESSLEKHFCLLAEADPQVARFDSQEVELEVFVAGAMRRYVPDLRLFPVAAAHDPTLVEVKPEAIRATPEFGELEAAATTAARARGYAYRVITDAQIRIQPRLTNLERLYRYARADNGLSDYQDIHRLFQGEQDMPLAELLNRAQAAGLLPHGIYHAMFNQFLIFDWSVVINGNTKVSICAGQSEQFVSL